MKFVKRLGLLALMALAVMPVRAETQTMSVQVRNGQLRATPSFLGKLVAAVAYADRVTVQQTQGEWRRVSAAGGQTGWIHQSALSPKVIVLKAGAEDVGTAASGEELALAGKGFNSDVEADFKKKNEKIDFGPIDSMEKIKIAPQDMLTFLNEGGLAVPK